MAGLTGASEVLTQTDTRYDGDKYRVVTTGVWDEDTPNTWQYQSAEKQEDGTYRYTYHVYDVEEVCTMIHVAVCCPRTAISGWCSCTTSPGAARGAGSDGERGALADVA